MTQDMIKTIRTIKMINNGKSAQREPSLLCSVSMMLRSVLLMGLMVTFGINVSWGQAPTPVDYSGTYYIASKSTKVDGTANLYTYNPDTHTDNYYLCPTKNWYFYQSTEPYYIKYENSNSDNGQPFLTTFKCKDGNHNDVAAGAVWIVEKHQTEANCYYIIQKNTSKYMVSNGVIGTNVNRMRVHLEQVANATALTNLGNLALFEIIEESGHLCIKPHAEEGKGEDNGVCDYLVVNNGNSNTLQASKGKTGGPNNVNTGGIIGVYKTEENAYWYLENALCAIPDINYVYDDTENELTLTLASETTGASVYYTEGTGLVDLSNPTTSDNHYESELTVTETTTIKAMTHKNYMLDSEPVMKKIVLNPTINLTIPQGGYTYDGTAKQPTVTSIKVGETTIDASEYEVSYSDNTNAGIETAKVNITAKDGSDYIVYGSTTFTINKANITPSMSVDDWSYGDTSTPVITGNSGEGTVTYEYKERGAEDASYTTTVPTVVGNYTVRATIAATTNYNGGSVTANFSITQKSLGDGTDPAPGISIDVTYDGSEYTVTVKQGESKTLTEGESYDYTKTGSSSANGKYYEVTITGQGNYEGSFTAKYALMKFDHKAASGEFTGTFVSDVDDGDFAVPNGMNAYIITDIRPAVDQVVAVRVDYIPEGVPVLLLYEDDASASPANGFLVKPKNEEITTVSTNKNLLRVTTTSTHFGTAEIYLLYKGEFVLNMVGDLAAGKIYLDNTTSGAHSSRLTIVWDESTGVEDVSEKKEDGRDGKWYTLDGRRLSDKPTKKGLYIRNREKRVVK